SFSQSMTLITHWHVHTSKKPFVCATCGKTFLHGSHLFQQCCVHTIKRPHIYSDCGKRFHQKLMLVIYWHIHISKKPFACDSSVKS
ncbi:ZG49 protein, partial [Baryphthengus martii]|nr:ZG49 protein [Baryphthengus martii]